MRNNDVAAAFTYCEWFFIVWAILKNFTDLLMGLGEFLF